MPSILAQPLTSLRDTFGSSQGTFHAKYCIIDRRIVLLNSNNIQDRVNVEMMTHIEGPIVHSFYDMALICWGNAMHPPLPLLQTPRAPQTSFDFGQDHSLIKLKDTEGAKQTSRSLLKEHHAYAVGDGDHPGTESAETKQQRQREGNQDSTTQQQQHKQAVFDLDNDAEVKRTNDALMGENDVSNHLSQSQGVFHPLALVNLHG